VTQKFRSILRSRILFVLHFNSQIFVLTQSYRFFVVRRVKSCLIKIWSKQGHDHFDFYQLFACQCGKTIGEHYCNVSHFNPIECNLLLFIFVTCIRLFSLSRLRAKPKIKLALIREQLHADESALQQLLTPRRTCKTCVIVSLRPTLTSAWPSALTSKTMKARWGTPIQCCYNLLSPSFQRKWE